MAGGAVGKNPYPGVTKGTGIANQDPTATSSALWPKSTLTGTSQLSANAIQQMYANSIIAGSNTVVPSGIDLRRALVDKSMLPDPPLLTGDEKIANAVARKLTGRYTEHDMKVLEYILAYQSLHADILLGQIHNPTTYDTKFIVNYKGEQIWPPV